MSNLVLMDSHRPSEAERLRRHNRLLERQYLKARNQSPPLAQLLPFPKAWEGISSSHDRTEHPGLLKPTHARQEPPDRT